MLWYVVCAGTTLYVFVKIWRNICSATRYTKFFNYWVYSALMLALHVSDLTGPSSGAFYKLYLQIWYVAQPLLRNGWTCRVVRVLPHTKSANTACKTLLMMDRWGPKHVELRNGWTCRIVRVLPHTKSANTACKTLLMMDRWGPKHVQLSYVMNKFTH